MHCNGTILAAYRSGALGFGISDAGWLAPWYLGAFAMLQKLGIITPGATPVGAVSGGSLAAATSCLGLNYQGDTMRAVHEAAAACRAKAGCAGTLADELGPRWRRLLTTAATREALGTCAANTYIYVSEGAPLKGSKPTRIDSTTTEGFVEGIVSTWYIPFWSNRGKPTTFYQGKPAYEGFYSLPMPCPPGASVCVRLSSRYPGPLLATPRPTEALLTAKADLMAGYRPPVPVHADIYPGRFNPCKYTPFELGYKLALAPGKAKDLDYLFNLGGADALAWAKHVGLVGNCPETSQGR